MDEAVKVAAIVFEAHTPSGAVYRVFDDGSAKGFPEGTVISNYWLALLDLDHGLRIQASKQGHVANQEFAKKGGATR